MSSRAFRSSRPKISKRIVSTFHQAVSLADAWSIIEATAKMVDAFIVEIKAKWIEESIRISSISPWNCGSGLS